MIEQDNRTGLMLALAGFTLLAIGDAVAKSMADEWSPIAVAGLRFVIGAIGLSAILWRKQGASSFRPRRPWLQIARGFCLAMATIFFFSGIFQMPLAEATALVFISPILTALLSGPILKERVGPVTLLASLIAFGGVLVVLRPNVLELGWVACLPLGSAFFFSLLVLANRASAGDGSPLSMQAFMAIVAAPILVCAALIGAQTDIALLQVERPDWTVVLRCSVIALTASTAHWLVFLGTTRAGAATIAPMTYIQLLVATLLGWLWFGDRPDLTTLGGAAIIIVAGLLLWWQGKPAAPANRK